MNDAGKTVEHFTPMTDKRSSSGGAQSEGAPSSVQHFVRMVRALLRHTNPFNLAEDHSQQWQAVAHQCDVIEGEQVNLSTAKTVDAQKPTASDDKLKLFLLILAAAGGEASGNDEKWNWINYFCDDAEPSDTFNQASKRKLTRVTHDSDTDNSVVYLTDAGRAFIAAAADPVLATDRVRP